MHTTNKPKAVSQIAVLSYNICFQAMTNNSMGSAPNLGKVCHYLPGSKLTVCGNHMAQLIDGLPTSLGVPSLDFVGLQEASHWYELPHAAPNTLGKMTCFHTREGRSDMATYYDGNKYTLVKSYAGYFTKDRPFQILVFTNTFDSSGTIFINVHNPHRYSYSQMQAQFKAAINGGLTEAEKSYRIIAVGDYNETSWDFVNKKMDSDHWTPLVGEGVNRKITVGTPVISCSEDGKWSNANMNDYGMRGGDYVFDSKDPAPIQVPPAYKYDEYMSDHLPVVALLPA